MEETRKLHFYIFTCYKIGILPVLYLIFDIRFIEDIKKVENISIPLIKTPKKTPKLNYAILIPYLHEVAYDDNCNEKH